MTFTGAASAAGVVDLRIAGRIYRFTAPIGTDAVAAAQLLVQRVELVEFVETDELDDTSRGASGYGSSGGHAALADGASQTASGPSTRQGA